MHDGVQHYTVVVPNTGIHGINEAGGERKKHNVKDDVYTYPAVVGFFHAFSPCVFFAGFM